MTEWEEILRRKPSAAPFVITMNADSTVEVWDDVDTKLDHNHAWHIVGLDYTIEAIDPTVPNVTASLVNHIMTLQLQRGVANEVLLNAFDFDIIMHHCVTNLYSASGLVVAPAHPRHIELDTVTREQHLRAIFRTAPDVPDYSAATIQLTGMIYYHLITAPSDGRTKLGIPIDEI